MCLEFDFQIVLTFQVIASEILFGRRKLPRWLSGKESACPWRRCKFSPWFRNIPWRKQQPTPVFLPGKSHGQRKLVGYIPWGCRVRHNLVTEQQQQHTVINCTLPRSSALKFLNVILTIGHRRFMESKDLLSVLQNILPSH